MEFTLKKLNELKDFVEWYKKNFDESDSVEHTDVITKLIDQKITDSWLENIYVTFKLSGQFKQFYPNGQIKAQGEYKDGQRSGKWFVFYESGEIRIKKIYRNGEAETAIYIKGFCRML